MIVLVSKPTDDFEAVRAVVEAIGGFETKDQQRIIRWVAEKVGLPEPFQQSGPPQSHQRVEHMPQHMLQTGRADKKNSECGSARSRTTVQAELRAWRVTAECMEGLRYAKNIDTDQEDQWAKPVVTHRANMWRISDGT